MRISIFCELTYKEKRKRNLCAFARFYASVQTGYILSSTGGPGPWVIWNTVFNSIKLNIIDGVLFKLLECHSANQLFMPRNSILSGRTFLIGCLLCLSMLLADFFELQFGLWFFFWIWCSQSKTTVSVKTFHECILCRKARVVTRNSIGNFVLTFFGKRLPFNATF